MNKYWKDATERVLWTMAYAGISVVITALTGVPYTWAPALTVALNMAKVFIARYVGDPDTASFSKGN